MKTAIAILILAATALAQAPSVVATTTITATAGTLACTGTPGATPEGVTTMKIECKASGAAMHVHPIEALLPSAPATSFTWSVQSGANQITWILTRGNSAPDGWQVAASDGAATTSKSGTF